MVTKYQNIIRSTSDRLEMKEEDILGLVSNKQLVKKDMLPRHLTSPLFKKPRQFLSLNSCHVHCLKCEAITVM